MGDNEMTDDTKGSSRVLGRLGSVGGRGVVRVEDRFAVDRAELWSALTDPGRLARWLGEVEGELRVGGGFRAHFLASGWQGTGRVQVCEPPRRLLVVTTEDGEQDEHQMEATLTVDGAQTLLVIEERGMPLGQRAAYGAGLQVHVEDLAAHLADRGRCDAQARWGELISAYRDVTPADSAPDHAGELRGV